MAKTFIDYMTEEDYNRYTELLEKAAEAKKNAPKAKRAPLTKEQKLAAAMKKEAALQALVDKMLAEQGE